MLHIDIVLPRRLIKLDLVQSAEESGEDDEDLCSGETIIRTGVNQYIYPSVVGARLS